LRDPARPVSTGNCHNGSQEKLILTTEGLPGLGWTGYFGEPTASRCSCEFNAMRWVRVPAGFWDDAPWGAISSDRGGVIVVEPIHPRGGLLGGSGRGKTSKLAALAKARKAAAEKKQQEASAGKEEKGAVGLLSKLAAKKGPVLPTVPTSPVVAVSPLQALDCAIPTLPAAAEFSTPEPLDIYMATISPPVPPPPKNIAGQTPHADPPATTESIVARPELPVIDHASGEGFVIEEIVLPCTFTQRASPSSFAVSMFGERIVKTHAEKLANVTLFYYSATVNTPPAASSNAFAEPSPDDKVLAAQSQVKGTVTISFESSPDQIY